mmetsp:Transcript_127737/g.408400  ORF Transcript_127737/g.408400 Transcript_127737/m.408400 type:complete len:336 (+) Transcript_127737:757-1764(+)
MAMSRETFVASKTGLDSGRVPDFCLPPHDPAKAVLVGISTHEGTPRWATLEALAHCIEHQHNAKVGCCILVAPPLMSNERREHAADADLKRRAGVHEPAQGAPEITHGLEGCDGFALWCIWPHHLHDQLVDQPREDLQDCTVLIGRPISAAPDLHVARLESLAPVRRLPCMCRVDPDRQKKLEGTLVRAHPKSTVEGLFRQELASRREIGPLSTDTHPQQGLRVELACGEATDVCVNLYGPGRRTSRRGACRSGAAIGFQRHVRQQVQELRHLRGIIGEARLASKGLNAVAQRLILAANLGDETSLLSLLTLLPQVLLIDQLKHCRWVRLGEAHG